MEQMKHPLDREIRRIMQQSPAQAPQGFEENVMAALRTETAREGFSIREMLKEYALYIAGGLAALFFLFNQARTLSWLRLNPAGNGKDAEKTILLFQSWLNGLADIFQYFSSSGIALWVVLAIVLYFTADRILHHYSLRQHKQNAPLLL
jgi:hypothetical protein